MSESGFGMMTGAYFVGRKELLSWLNDLLYLNYTKVEQCASAAAHCQIMDAIYPGKVPLSKVNFNATQTYEFVENFKTLQKVFKLVGIERQIDVNSLIKAKYQDNLEFLQWIKCYYDHYNRSEFYDAESRRKECGINVSVKCGGRGNPSATPSKTVPTTTTTSTNTRRSVTQPTSTPKPVTSKTTSIVNTPKPTTSNTTTTTTKQTTTTTTIKSNSRPSTSRQPTTSSRTSLSVTNTNSTSVLRSKNPTQSEEMNQKDQKITNLTNQIKELNLVVQGLGKERDFYFNRLRQVEIFCQTYPDQSDILQEIEKILYSTDEMPLKVDYNDSIENQEPTDNLQF